MPKNGIVSQEEFEKIKMLFGYGMRNAQIVKATNRSDDTVRRIKKVDTYDDFILANKITRDKRNIREAEQQKMDLCDDEKKEEQHIDQDCSTEYDPDSLRIRVSFELGETARKAIDGLLALVGVKL